MIPKIEGSQRDFSAGEVDVELKRGDENPILKAGVRQMSNWRILNSKAVTNRPGRSILYTQDGRTERVLIAAGVTYDLCFGNDGSLKIRDSTGAVVASQPAATYPWLTATLKSIVWCAVPRDVIDTDIIITFPGMVPQIARWSASAGAWSFLLFSFSLSSNSFNMPFLRIAPVGVGMQPSAITGSISVTTDSAYFLPAMAGRIVRWLGQQIRLDTYVSTTVFNATVLADLPLSETVTINPSKGTYTAGDILIGSTGLEAEVVTVVSVGATSVLVVNYMSPARDFAVGESVTGPAGTGTVAGVVLAGPQNSTQWDEAVIDAYRGYPASCFFDQTRLGFCNIPGAPSGIAWSAIGSYDNFAVGSAPENGMFELVPGKSQVLFVVPGPESSEFVFCDNALYYIPISVTNPLKPGSVAFNLLSKDGSASVQPRAVQEMLVYINAGQTNVMGVVAPGAYNRPFETRNLSELHSHLFNTPFCIAAPTATASFEERYLYVVNTNGTVVVGKYATESGQIKGVVGWCPWSSPTGVVKNVAAHNADVIFSSVYTVPGAAQVNVAEILDPTRYLDAAVSVNSAPGGFSFSSWNGGTVTLMDQATRPMGDYQVSGGSVVPQGVGGENLASAQLVAGQSWTAILEPFAPDAAPGQSMHQRMFKRRISRMAVYVINSTGFLMARLFSGPVTRTSPALGTVMNQYRVTTYNQDDDPTQPPPLREEAQRWRPRGRSFDPRVAVIKDTPGPLTVAEIGLEATI